MKTRFLTVLSFLTSLAWASLLSDGANPSDAADILPVPYMNEEATRSLQYCTQPLVRKEWRSLSTAEKASYISAVQCLANKPSISKDLLPGAVSRYDDFQGVHCNQTDGIHWVGHFPLWHRYFVATYERALREECGYTGAQPYWDWLIDTKSGKNMTEWPIFDPVTGFGGNGPYIAINDTEDNPLNITGRTGGGCVQDGPFTVQNFNLSIGPSHDVFTENIHCLTRDFAPDIATTNLVQWVWDAVVSKPDYGTFERRLEAIPSFSEKNVHGGGHFGVGGVLGSLGDQYNSPGDPIFYLHHGNLDRLYWKWQQLDLPTRFFDVSGNIEPFDYSNTLAGNVTLEFRVNLGKLAPEVMLAQLTNTAGGTLCYTYDG